MKIKIIVILFTLVSNLTAQSNEGVKTVIGNGNPKYSYFLMPSCQFGKIAGSVAIVPGIGAGIIINNNFSLDLKYKFIASENTPSGEVNKGLYLDGQWFGIRSEYLIRPEKVVHFSFPLEIGMGEIELDLKDFYTDQNVSIPSDDAWYVNLEPGVSIEINLWKYMKINFTAGYRIASNFTFRNLSERDMMGFTYSAGLKAGIF